MKPAYDVGIYSAPYRILEVIIFFPAAYLGLIMPLLSKQAIENLNDFKKIFQKTFNVLAIFAIPLTAFLLLRAGDIVGIINGVGFEDSAPVLSILSVAIALIFFGNLGGNALIALDLQKKGVWFYFSGALLNISVNLIFIPKFSYLATAWSTVATELLITLGIFALIYKETKILPNVAALIKPIVVTILVAAVLRPLGLPFWWAAFLSLAYFPLLYLFRGFRMRDFAEIISKTI
jgi:O-antigen/teichoic acid export membrane protein